MLRGHVWDREPVRVRERLRSRASCWWVAATVTGTLTFVATVRSINGVSVERVGRQQAGITYYILLCSIKKAGKVGFGSNKVEFQWKSIVLHIKLKIIEFYREKVVPVSYEIEVLFSYGTVYPLIVARLILYLFLAGKK